MLNYWLKKLKEFLKAAIMQSENCAKYLRIWPNFGLMNAEVF